MSPTHETVPETEGQRRTTAGVRPVVPVPRTGLYGTVRAADLDPCRPVAVGPIVTGRLRRRCRGGRGRWVCRHGRPGLGHCGTTPRNPHGGPQSRETHTPGFSLTSPRDPLLTRVVPTPSNTFLYTLPRCPATGLAHRPWQDTRHRHSRVSDSVSLR